MKNRKKIIKVFQSLFVLSFIFMVLSMLVLFINIEQNKGIVPLIFLYSTLFYLFSNYEYLMPRENKTLRIKKEKIDIVYRLLNIFGLVLSVLFFIISYYVFWA